MSQRHVCQIVRLIPSLQNRLNLNNVVNIAMNLFEDEYEEDRACLKNTNYYEDVIPTYSLDEFRAHFRMNREAMEKLTNIIGRHMDKKFYVIPLEKQVMITVWLLSKPESFFAAGDRFGISSGTAHYCFSQVIRILAMLLGTYIRWPDPAQATLIAEAFQTHSKIPGVIGVIDSCHIPITQPINDAVDYYNRKGFHSIILQAVYDHQRKFTDVFIGIQGSVRAARVFRNSPLYANLVDHNLIPENHHLIGDAAYPLHSFLITPFRNNGHLTPEQVRYNERLSSIRSIIKRTFSLLKGKFQRLKYLEMSDMHLIKCTIGAACVLHNFILSFDEYVDEHDELEELQEKEEDDTEEDNDFEYFAEIEDQSGAQKRNEITQLLN